MAWPAAGRAGGRGPLSGGTGRAGSSTGWGAGRDRTVLNTSKEIRAVPVPTSSVADSNDFCSHPDPA